MKKIKVLHVLMSMDIGGIENFIMNIYRSMDKKKYCFDFCLWKKGDNHYEYEIKKMGGKIHKIDFTKNVFSNIRQFRSILVKSDYDIVHIHSHFYSGFFAYAAYKENIPNVITHFHSFLDNKKNTLFRKIYVIICRHLIIKYSTKLCACSEEAAKYGFGDIKNVIIINNFIDVEKFVNVDNDIISKIKSKYVIDDNQIVIGTVGRLSIEKNQSFILKIAFELKKKNVNYKCLLIGDGPCKDELLKYVNDNELCDNVIFVGSKDNINEYLNVIDIFLFPSIYEGFGIALLEAQASSCYCISSDSVPKSTDMDLGLVDYVSLKCPEKWIDLITNYNKKKISRKLIYRRILEKGFDIKSSTAEMANIYGGGNDE